MQISSITRVRKILALLATAAVLGVLGFAAAADDGAADWRADVDAFVRVLEEKHDNPYFLTPKAAFAAKRQRFVADLPRMNRAERIVGFARLVALVGDGHTWMPLHAVPFDGMPPGPGFRPLPIRFELFDDGLFVVGATADYADLVGARVVRLGKQTPDVAVERALSLLPQDAVNFSREFVPEWLMLGEVLAALGLSDDAASIAVEVLKDGKRWTRAVNSVDPGLHYDWIASMDGGLAASTGVAPRWLRAAAATPLWRESFAEPWRVQKADDAIYLQINEVRRASGRPLSEAARTAGALATGAPTRRLVIDLRRCSGGDGSLIADFIAELGRQGWSATQGEVLALTSRQTHSAGVMLVSALEQRTKAVFFGQATADRPNHYGETNIFVLPHNGLPVLHASEYYQTSTANDHRRFRAPDVFVPYLFADYVRGNDPVLTAALHRNKEK